MSLQNIPFTTIQPSAEVMHVTFPQRSKEGEAEKPALYASFFLPAVIESIANPEIKAFASRAYTEAVKQVGDKARKAGLAEFNMPALDELFVSTGKREFLIKKPDLLAWINDYALPIISAAIAIKSGLHIDSPKVVKKGIAYREQLLLIASRQIMSQEQIDSALKVLELVCSTDKTNAYTDNVAQALARKQEKLDDFLANGEDDDSEAIDF